MPDSKTNSGVAEFVIFILSIAFLSFGTWQMAGIAPAALVAGLMLLLHHLLSWRLAVIVMTRVQRGDN